MAGGRDKVIAARTRAQALAARRVRNWIFGPEATFEGDPGRRVTADHTVTLPGRVIKYETDVAAAHVTVGRWSGVSHTAVLMPGGQHHADWVSAVHVHWTPEGWTIPDEALDTRAGITIGNDVLVGYEAMVLPGVTIGDGAVVASRAVVVKDVAPYEIVGGNPAKHVKFRFDEPTRDALLRIAWWNWPDEKVLALRHEIDSPDVAGFIARHDPTPRG